MLQSEWNAARTERKAAANEVVTKNAEKARKDLEAYRKQASQPAPVQEEVDETHDDSGEAGPYDGLTNDELSAELEARGLPHSGNKSELIARLTESDAAAE